MELIAIVPARGGSKRLPRKNLLPFAGVPLIERVVRTLSGCSLVSKVIVSTDDLEIADLAQSAGGLVPQLRSTDLSDDFTATAPVVLDALGWLDSTPKDEDLVLVAYPTSVFLDGTLIDRLVDRIAHQDVEHVFVAVELGCPIGRSWSRQGEIWRAFDPIEYFARSQDLPEAFSDAGQGYVSRKSAWQKLAQGVIPSSAAVVVDRWEAIDIDTESDFKLAETIFRATRSTS